MTPREHYIEAERLLAVAEDHDWRTARTVLAAAQVHADLARTAYYGVDQDPSEASRPLVVGNPWVM